MVGLVTEKVPNPRLARVVPVSVTEVGGEPLPNPVDALGVNTSAAPTPEIAIAREPKFQVRVEPKNVPLKVDTPPTPVVPATTTTPAPLAQ